MPTTGHPKTCAESRRFPFLVNGNTLWLFNIAMENNPFIDDFPSYKHPFIIDFPVCYVK
jgi:hypothetical protein